MSIYTQNYCTFPAVWEYVFLQVLWWDCDFNHPSKQILYLYSENAILETYIKL